MTADSCCTTVSPLTVVINRVEFTLVTKVDGNAGSPVIGQFTYQNNILRNALDVQYIFVEKEIKTIIDDDFTFNATTGTITRPIAWANGDSLIIRYAKQYDTSALWADGGDLPTGPAGPTGPPGAAGPTVVILPTDDAFIVVESGVPQSFGFSSPLPFVLNTNGDKVFYNLMDKNTDELITVYVATSLPSGAAITDADVDNVIYFKVKPTDGGGYSKRVVTGYYNALWFGAVGDSDLTGNTGTDNYDAIQAAIDSVPSGATLFFPTGVYATSGGFTTSNVICLLGEGAFTHRNTAILPNADFTLDEPLFTFTNTAGRTCISQIASPMNLRGGTWAKFIGDGGGYFIEKNYVSGVTSGNWGIEFDDPTGANGAAALSNIIENVFSSFEGGAIKAMYGGDSTNILRNHFQLGNSTSHILLWYGKAGAFCLNFSENNATGASKFIEVFTAWGAKFTKNQFEATVAIDNTADAMLCIHGSLTTGYADSLDISDNNFGGHNNVESAIYLDKSWYTQVKNNNCLNLTNHLRTDTLTRRCTLTMGGSFTGITTVVDPPNAVSIFNPSIETFLQGNLRMRGVNQGHPQINFTDTSGLDITSSLNIDAPDSYDTQSTIDLFRFTGTNRPDLGIGSTGARIFRIFNGRGTSATQHSFGDTGASINIVQGFLALGLATALAKFHIIGASQITSAFDTSNGVGLDNVLMLDSTTSGNGAGGAIVFSGVGYRFAAIKGLLTNNGAATVGQGDLAFSIRKLVGDATLTEALIIKNSGRIGINNSSPNASSILDIVSTTSGILIPRMTTAERDAISTPLEGLLIYNATTHTFNFRNDSAWGEIMRVDNLGKITLPNTVTASGTTGAQTIDKPSGQVNFAAAETTLVVTNSLATTTSQIFVQVYGTDTTALTARVTKAAGSFTITLNAAATAETAVGFFLIN